MRIMKLTVLILSVSICLSFCVDQAGENSYSKDIENLLARMTLEEKVGQMTQMGGLKEEREQLVREGRVGSFLYVSGAELTNRIQKIAVEESRLGIPLIFADDVIHGYRTIFPVPLAEACSWDTEMVQKAAAIAAKEARATGLHWTFGPMVDMARDPRWGRMVEGAGEDPFLASAMAVARVKGFQGEDMSAPDRLLSCLKHYAAYGGAEAGRDYNTVDMSERRLREIYLPPFQAGVANGAMSLMTAFNSLNGIPTTGSRFLLTDILREEWGFQGFVVSDMESIPDMIVHGWAADKKDAAAKALYAGVDMEMENFEHLQCYPENLVELVNEGKVPEEWVDEAVRRILRVKHQLGLFGNPYVDPQIETEVIYTAENLKAARDMARKSMVLLRNENKLLPLQKDLSSIALIGPLANTQAHHMGRYYCRGEVKDVVSVLDGIKDRVSSQTKVVYAKGCDIQKDKTDGFAEAVALAKKSDVAIVVVGEAGWMSSEASNRTNLDLPGKQKELVQAIHATQTPVVVVVMNGRPLTINWMAENIPAIVEAWHPGTQTGHALADVLFGVYNPSGKLAVTFPRNVGQIPLYYNHENTGKPPTKKRLTSKYLDSPNTPLFPFGYGLSYTEFEYSNLKISPDSIHVDETVEISADIKNIGDYEGEEVVQLYIRDLIGSVIRPVKELKGFKKVFLNPGESKTVTFKLEPKHLGFYDQKMEFSVEPGEFRVWIARNSQEGLEGSFRVVENKR